MLPATLRAAGATLESCSITISGSDTGDLRPSCCTAHAARRRRRTAKFFRMKLSLQVLERLLRRGGLFAVDRKSTRLNSSHVSISYAVFCLKKKTRKHAYLGVPCLLPSAYCPS